METLWHVLTVLSMIVVAIGALAVVGYVLLWIFGMIDWMNRGSH